jgi:uncharacterized protein YndB with AHSA1/START domain
VETALPAPPPLVWDYMTDPAKRMLWQVGTDRVDQTNPAGRRGAGTTNHCVHGHGTVVEEILDWRPFHYYTIRAAVPGLGMTTYTFEFTPTETGTRLHFRLEKLRKREQREMWLGGVRDQWLGLMNVWMGRLSELLTTEMATRESEPSVPSTPPPAPPHAH